MTKRQLEVLQLICKGLCYKEIADRLGITFETAKKHKKNMLQRLGAKSSGQLVYIAMKRNLIS